MMTVKSKYSRVITNEENTLSVRFIEFKNGMVTLVISNREVAYECYLEGSEFRHRKALESMRDKSLASAKSVADIIEEITKGVPE